MNKNIKDYVYMIVLVVLFILASFTKGYIGGIPLICLMAYISIPLLIYTGIKQVKENKKLNGWGKILISLGLIFMFIKQYILK